MKKMDANTPEYERWKVKMKEALDDLVAQNFERLYTSHGSERSDVWGGVVSQLHRKFMLAEISEVDSKIGLKRKEHCIYINVRLYAEKEFPYELNNPETYRFVQKYGKLPGRLQKEWGEFTRERRMGAEKRVEESHRMVIEAIRRYKEESAVNV